MKSWIPGFTCVLAILICPFFESDLVVAQTVQDEGQSIKVVPNSGGLFLIKRDLPKHHRLMVIPGGSRESFHLAQSLTFRNGSAFGRRISFTSSNDQHYESFCLARDKSSIYSKNSSNLKGWCWMPIGLFAEFGTCRQLQAYLEKIEVAEVETLTKPVKLRKLKFKKLDLPENFCN